MNTRSFLTLFLFSLCLIIPLSNAQNKGFSVELIHSDSPKSPLYKHAQNKYQHFVNAARRSINRVNHFYHDSHTSTPQPTIIHNNGEYLLTYSIGTPPMKVYGVLDTGSDVVWLQCEHCQQCYNQTTPKFNPSKSSSYENIYCYSDYCESVSYYSCNGEPFNCYYNKTYGDKSYSQGDLGFDTYRFESTNGHHVSFPRMPIGCGINNTVSYDGAINGIVGLGNGPLSLISQLPTPGGKFSYCLPPLSLVTNIESNMTSKLNFGDAAVVSGDGFVSTPMVRKDPFAFYTTFYYLTLEAFSVGNKRVEFGGPPNGDNEGNIIIDSGTTLTLLPNNVYTNLESAVVDLVKLKRVGDPNKILGLCYSVTPNGYNFPLITAHFKGADVNLDPISTFVPVADGVFCLAFASSQKGAIFGNLAQQNLLVGYDVRNYIVSFKPTDCSKV